MNSENKNVTQSLDENTMEAVTDGAALENGKSLSQSSLFLKEYTRSKDHLRHPRNVSFFPRAWMRVLLMGAYLSVTEYFLLQQEESFPLLASAVSLLTLGYFLLAFGTPGCIDWGIFLFSIPFSAYLTRYQGLILIYVSVQVLAWAQGGRYTWIHNAMILIAAPIIIWVIPGNHNWLLAIQYLITLLVSHNKRINECPVALTIALAFWRDIVSVIVVLLQMLTCQF